MAKERKTVKSAKRILTIVGLLLTAVAMIGLVFTFMEYRNSDRIYRQAQEEFVTAGKKGADDSNMSEKDGKTSVADSDSSVSRNESERAWYELASVDLEGLQAAYPEAVGWIFFENEAISYPIMYSGDNEKYLRTACTGKSAVAGSVFLDGESSLDFSDPHTLIYGHNMKNLSMFGRLKYYKTKEGYYENHQYFQIFTSDRICRYRIFAYGDVPAHSSVYDVYGPDVEELSGLIQELEKNSYQDTGVEVGESDHIVTLSTCTGDGDKRMIVSAVRVDEVSQLSFTHNYGSNFHFGKTAKCI